jgi:2-polyprenyl-6-hydroxyphenyl methylase/3-demethylubiquinone-9 3-methyltransferase
MNRLTDVAYWEKNWWGGGRPERLRLYRDFDFETVRLLRNASHSVDRNEHSPQGKPPAKCPRVLEIGGGGSRVLPYLSRKFGVEVYGTDFSLTGCRLLRANLALVGTPGSVICEDLFESSLVGETFDLVYSSGLIEHFEDTRSVVAQHVRLLRPGGRLVVIVPNLLGFEGKIVAKLAPPLRKIHKILGPDDLVSVLRAIGLREVRAGYLGSFFIHVGRGPEWSVLTRWPVWARLALHGGLRVANAIVALLFRLSPVRPHTRAFSPACFAVGTKCQP